MSVLTSASVAGRKLYHDIWRDAGRLFFYANRLKEWADWEHRFDDEIQDRDSGRRCVEIMLASLGDRYTRLLSDDETKERKRHQEASTEAVFGTRLPGSLGFIGLHAFEEENLVEQLQAALVKLSDCCAYIVDLRLNPGGSFDLMTGCAELLMPDGPLFWLEARSESGIEKTEIGLVDDAYLRIVTKADGSEDISAAMRRPCLVGKKRIVLLIGEDTGSSAELLAAALLKDGREDKRVIAIGKQTHGKGFGQAFKEYEDGSVLKVTFCHFYSADDVWFGDCGQTTAAGVKPDLDVEGRYEQFQAALSYLNQLPVVV